MSDVTRSGAGAQRASEAVLRAGGGRTVTVLVPRPAEPGVLGEQLGLGTPQFDALELSPVLLREKTAATGEREGVWEMLVPASRAEALSGGTVAAVRAFFAGAAAVQADGALLRVVEVSSQTCAGAAYLYRVRLQMAAAGSL